MLTYMLRELLVAVISPLHTGHEEIHFWCESGVRETKSKSSAEANRFNLSTKFPLSITTFLHYCTPLLSMKTQTGYTVQNEGQSKETCAVACVSRC